MEERSAMISTEDVVLQHLRQTSMFELVLESEKAAKRIARAVQEHLRDQVGARDCQCEGCDSCVQHALIDTITEPVDGRDG